MVASAWILVMVKLGEAACGPPGKAFHRPPNDQHSPTMTGTAANPRASFGTEETQVEPCMTLHAAYSECVNDTARCLHILACGFSAGAMLLTVSFAQPLQPHSVCNRCLDFLAQAVYCIDVASQAEPKDNVQSDPAVFFCLAMRVWQDRLDMWR